MIEDSLKLTAYFGERERVGKRFLADELLDLFGSEEVATSILLRGISGFGLRHHLRTDQSLTLSEDPPVIAIAVDTSRRMEKVVEKVVDLRPRGVLTLERSLLVRNSIGRPDLPEELTEATKLTIYLGRHERVTRGPAFIAVCDLLRRRGIAGASVFVGVDGTVHGQRQRGRFFDRNVEVPTMIIAVGSGSRIEEVLPELETLLKRPLITVERVRVCKRDGELIERPHALPNVDGSGLGLWQKMMVYTSESDLHEGEPIHRELVRRLRMSPVARGATVLRGIWGFHGDHDPHGDRMLQLGRRVPVATIVVDTPEHIAQCFDIVDELTAQRGLVTTEMVPALASFDDGVNSGGLRLARHDF